MLNYFTTLGEDNPDARGAETAEEFAIQESKIVTAINKLDADVVALQEIENSVKFEANDPQQVREGIHAQKIPRVQRPSPLSMVRGRAPPRAVVERRAPSDPCGV